MFEYNKSLSYDEINALVNDFSVPFGDVDNVTLKVLLTPIEEGGYHPTVTIDTQDTIYTFRVDIHVMNPFDDSIDAMVM